MKLELKDTKLVPLQEFVSNAKRYIVDLNNNDCEEIVITKERGSPYLIMMKYAKLALLVDSIVQSKIREINNITSKLTTVNMLELSSAEISLLKIKSKLACFKNMSDKDIINVTDTVEFLLANWVV